MIRVALVDDHTLVRQGIRALLHLAEGLQVVLEASDGEEALERLPGAGVDVLLLDLRMPRKGGLDVLRELAARGAVLPTLILTTFHDDAELFQCLRLGARGYLLKDVSLGQLTSAIREVHAGRTLVQPVLTERLQQELGGPAVPEQPESLTSRETEVLRLMSGGYSNREIAGALSLAEGTVKNHVSVILSKLGVRDRTRAVLAAIEQGLI